MPTSNTSSRFLRELQRHLEYKVSRRTARGFVRNERGEVCLRFKGEVFPVPALVLTQETWKVMQANGGMDPESWGTIQRRDLMRRCGGTWGIADEDKFQRFAAVTRKRYLLAILRGTHPLDADGEVVKGCDCDSKVRVALPSNSEPPTARDQSTLTPAPLMVYTAYVTMAEVERNGNADY